MWGEQHAPSTQRNITRTDILRQKIDSRVVLNIGSSFLLWAQSCDHLVIMLLCSAVSRNINCSYFILLDCTYT